MKTSKPEDEQEKCKLYAKQIISTYNPRQNIKGKGIKYSYSLTQHGGSSRISMKRKRRDLRSQRKIGRGRDPIEYFITGQDPCLMKFVPKRFIYCSLS